MAYPSHTMEYAWSTRQDTYPRATSEIAVDRGSITTCLLIPVADDSDSQIDGLFRDIRHWYPDQSMNDGHAQVLQSLRYHFCAG
jgi:hypothetical protein